MITPSGRFQTNARLCLSFSDFHPQSWNPSWMVSTIITGLISFMTSEEMTTGGLNAPACERRRLASVSREWNTYSNPRFKEEFPEIYAKNLEFLTLKKEEAANAAALKKCVNSVQNNSQTGGGGGLASSLCLPMVLGADGQMLKRNSLKRFNLNKWWIFGFLITACILAKLLELE